MLSKYIFSDPGGKDIYGYLHPSGDCYQENDWENQASVHFITETLLKLFFCCNRLFFFFNSLGLSTYKIISVNRDNFVSFLIWMPFVIYFSRLIALAVISSTMLNSSGKNEHPSLVLPFKGKLSISVFHQ